MVLPVRFTRREGRELLFCLAGLPFAVISPVALFLLAVDLIWLTAGNGRGNPPPATVVLACLCVGLLLALLVSAGAARRIGDLQRTLATRLLGTNVAAPPQARRGPRAWPGPRDAAGWRVIAYLLAKVPAGLIELFAVSFWVGGLVNLGYPLWWEAFRNHAAGVRLSPVPVFTPFGWSGQGTFRVATGRRVSAQGAGGRRGRVRRRTGAGRGRAEWHSTPRSSDSCCAPAATPTGWRRRSPRVSATCSR